MAGPLTAYADPPGSYLNSALPSGTRRAEKLPVPGTTSDTGLDPPAAEVNGDLSPPSPVPVTSRGGGGRREPHRLRAP